MVRVLRPTIGRRSSEQGRPSRSLLAPVILAQSCRSSSKEIALVAAVFVQQVFFPSVARELLCALASQQHAWGVDPANVYLWPLRSDTWAPDDVVFEVADFARGVGIGEKAARLQAQTRDAWRASGHQHALRRHLRRGPRCNCQKLSALLTCRYGCSPPASAWPMRAGPCCCSWLPGQSSTSAASHTWPWTAARTPC